ncbi:MAG TPA: OB-fold nucleic acid binding domain-containing protein, partial [Methylophilaceae bacterium]|nr:OB-fold nucleic acid binding domain-containing protein [Methylophilaceae bacterium]
MSEQQIQAAHSADNNIAQDENHVIAERREKLKAIREKGVAFPNDFKPGNQAAELQTSYGERSNEELETLAQQVSIGGRMMLKRVMGKASFATVQDKSGRIQLFIAKDNIGEELYEAFKKWDLGDIV